jgi:hypothetical protein
MSLLRSRECGQADEAVEAFSKLEGEIRELVSGTSVQEIEKLIAELQILREMLQKEAARVQREIVGYAVLIQNARQSMRTTSEILSFWQNDRDDTPRISA